MRWWLRVLFVLPIRWLAHHARAIAGQQQLCKRCGQTSAIDFIASDATWTTAVPPRWRKRVLCLRCFECLANDRGVHVVRVFLVNGP